MSTIINLAGPLSPSESQLVERANRLRQRAESIKADLQNAPSDNVVLDKKSSNDRLGLYYYTGSIGADGFSKANASFRDSKVDAFVAHDPQGAEGATVKFHTSRSQATGLRAGVAATFGAIGGGLGNAAAFFLAQAWTTESKLAANTLAAISKPFEFGSDLMRLVEDKVSDPGTRDELYASVSPSGDYEQYVFTAGGTLEASQTKVER